MDIAKYIGIYLLKNEYCYLPGIGSLQVIKRSAHFNKETLQTDAPGYEVVFVKGVGSIDDAFANFIANNERVSIAHASNHIKDYSANAKQLLLNGSEIVIPGIGKLKAADGENNFFFETEPGLRIQGKSIPFFKNSTNLNQKKEASALSNIIEQTSFKEPKADEEIVMQQPQVNWGKVIITTAIILIILALSIFLILRSVQDKDSNEEPLLQTEPTEQVDVPMENLQPVDTTQATDSVPVQDTVLPQPLSQQVNNGQTIRIAVNTYSTQERADSRMAKLQSFGYDNVSVQQQDTATFYVVLTLQPEAGVDITHIVDSVGRMLSAPNKAILLP